MHDIELSLNYSSDNCESVVADLLSEFEKRMNMHVTLQWLGWGEAWTEFMKISLYHHGPVISEVGNTWTPSLSSHNSLRHFQPRELASFGGKDVFLPEVWKSCIEPGTSDVTAIPWTLGTYLIFYRRDLLEKAGIDEAAAFSSTAQFHQTLEQLQARGVKGPYVVSTEGTTLGTVHNIASWIWDAGGDFTTPQGKRAIFSDPKTRAGMKAYFDLHRYFHPQAHRADATVCWDLFMKGETAVTLYNQAYLSNIADGQVPPELAAKIGVAMQPGVPYIGASNLVLWKHVPFMQEQSALELIRYLISTDFLLPHFERTGVLPARVDTLNRITSPQYQPAIDSLKKGRTFPHTRLWGLVEGKLAVALNQIWGTLFENPQANVEATIADILDPLEDRLNLTLSN